mmetsp:Transcript_15630/g.23528  ORF Transcript_15630/g.23528 Transcript_15630/m.23528 type:complete len:230 (-) Transcript_15630:260-949(-)|eukprot:CAMPEP_0197287080 /NCGR_PEP_ID=MMETSP0890-20130614/3107_1 /TAXON_ID=44058 ORGANISM="Aureoumbra lagunensis, Strain CCMP1510" /NCGR_SAMPLE_ID=MMETSP0890 /ASSEMBLY_ACC=CAM_ASM_000533 /LENGTH=229 /DNA_ID=CAMNT_0042756311 /DNA_START=35 /DNA_END=724 /DNA_ORIENTATION=-
MALVPDPPCMSNLSRQQNAMIDENIFGGLKDNEVSTGTTIMAVAYDGGVIMGADSRVSTGSYVANRVSDKVTKIHDRIFACRSGSAADTQAVTDYVRHYLCSHALEAERPPLVSTAASLCKRICYSNKDQLLASLIIAGWDPVDGGSVFAIPLGGTCIKVPFAIGGSGSTYIYGHVDNTYKPNMTKQECTDFVQEAISRAMQRDGSSGGIIRLVVIEQDSVDRHYITLP